MVWAQNPAATPAPAPKPAEPGSFLWIVNNPGVQTLITILGGFLSGTYLQWHKDRKARLAYEAAHEEEEDGEQRDWQLRCIRLENDYGNEVAFTERLFTKLSKYEATLIQACYLLKEPSKVDSDRTRFECATKLEYFALEIETELRAHKASSRDFKDSRVKFSQSNAHVYKEPDGPPHGQGPHNQSHNRDQEETA